MPNVISTCITLLWIEIETCSRVISNVKNCSSSSVHRSNLINYRKKKNIYIFRYFYLITFVKFIEY